MIRINNLQKNFGTKKAVDIENYTICLLYTSPSPRDS